MILNLKPYLSLIILGLFLRILLMPFLFHPDIKTQYYHASFLKTGITNIYSFIKENKETLSYKDTFNYPPLMYFLLGSWAYITDPLLGNSFNNWLSNWGNDWYTNEDIFRQMFILKFPYLVLDLLIGILLILILKDQFKKIGLMIWLFNPITLYIIYGLSNFDVIPTFFTFLALFFFKKERYFLSGVSIGLGIASKLFPVLFLPFFLVSLVFSKKVDKFIKFILGVLITALIPAAFFFNDFINSSSNGLITQVLNPRIFITSQISIPIFIIAYSLLLLFSMFKKLVSWQWINFYIVTLLFTIILLIRIHPQWLLWSLPFLIILIAKRLKLLIFLLTLLIGYLITIIGYQDRFLTLGILSPIFPTIYDSTSLEEVIFAHINKETFLQIGQILTWVSVVSILSLSFRDLKKHDNK